VIEFRPLAESDLPLLEEWLRREHVARWWSEPIEQEMAERREALERRDATDYYVIELDGRPIGHIQTYLAAEYPEWDAIVQAGRGVAGVDLLIGEQDLIGEGLGPEVIRAFVEQVVFDDPAVHACIATVEEANRRSWRAFEKAGFRHVGDVVEDGVPCRLMRLDPSWASPGRPAHARMRPR
jgi:aminoglycoside 6'-N-acetyltransferase